MDSSTLTLWSSPFLIERVSSWSLLLQCFVEIPVVNTNSVEPYKKPQTAATDLGKQCLPMLLLWDARHKWVNVNNNKLLHLKLT